ncbi:MAG: hypothetical protein BIP78_0967 [Candidatus Bipolaricaulis sibiricus]|uniref:Uncharacterized protein n=1 Tax=Bipolaricaulis sibiricus TaxID=2501609 RepID=A0A410FUM5_BIPS1|nr:MAG: hypothetical protein BIP78_0967 [Candidatus Bipolaricaulis sibiricus]
MPPSARRYFRSGARSSGGCGRTGVRGWTSASGAVHWTVSWGLRSLPGADGRTGYAGWCACPSSRYWERPPGRLLFPNRRSRRGVWRRWRSPRTGGTSRLELSRRSGSSTLRTGAQPESWKAIPVRSPP